MIELPNAKDSILERHTGVTRVILRGDPRIAEAYLKRAQVYMGWLRHNLALAGIGHGVRRMSLENGVTIRLLFDGAMNIIEIYAPPVAAAADELRRRLIFLVLPAVNGGALYDPTVWQVGVHKGVLITKHEAAAGSNLEWTAPNSSVFSWAGPAGRHVLRSAADAASDVQYWRNSLYKDGQLWFTGPYVIHGACVVQGWVILITSQAVDTYEIYAFPESERGAVDITAVWTLVGSVNAPDEMESGWFFNSDGTRAAHIAWHFAPPPSGSAKRILSLSVSAGGVTLEGIDETPFALVNTTNSTLNSRYVFYNSFTSTASIKFYAVLYGAASVVLDTAFNTTDSQVITGTFTHPDYDTYRVGRETRGSTKTGTVVTTTGTTQPRSESYSGGGHRFIDIPVTTTINDTYDYTYDFEWKVVTGVSSERKKDLTETRSSSKTVTATFPWGTETILSETHSYSNTGSFNDTVNNTISGSQSFSVSGSFYYVTVFSDIAPYDRIEYSGTYSQAYNASHSWEYTGGNWSEVANKPVAVDETRTVRVVSNGVVTYERTETYSDTPSTGLTFSVPDSFPSSAVNTSSSGTSTTGAGSIGRRSGVFYDRDFVRKTCINTRGDGGVSAFSAGPPGSAYQAVAYTLSGNAADDITFPDGGTIKNLSAHVSSDHPVAVEYNLDDEEVTVRASYTSSNLNESDLTRTYRRVWHEPTADDRTIKEWTDTNFKSGTQKTRTLLDETDTVLAQHDVTNLSSGVVYEKTTYTDYNGSIIAQESITQPANVSETKTPINFLYLNPRCHVHLITKPNESTPAAERFALSSRGESQDLGEITDPLATSSAFEPTVDSKALVSIPRLRENAVLGAAARYPYVCYAWTNSTDNQHWGAVTNGSVVWQLIDAFTLPDGTDPAQVSWYPVAVL